LESQFVGDIPNFNLSLIIIINNVIIAVCIIFLIEFIFIVNTIIIRIPVLYMG